MNTEMTCQNGENLSNGCLDRVTEANDGGVRPHVVKENWDESGRFQAS